MHQTTAGRWVRLQEGEHFVGNFWPIFEGRQRREILVTALWSGEVPMRARFSAEARLWDGQPVLPNLERYGLRGTTTPLPNVESILLRTDPRALNWDIPSSRIVISVSDDKRTWGPFDLEPFFPSGAAIATGRSLVIELDDVEFDRTAARVYIVENLLPNDATLSDDTAMAPTPLDSAAAPPAEGKVIPFAYHTGLAGRPTSWELIEAECRRRYAAGGRHPGRLDESRAEWARVLIVWLKSAHKGAPVPKQKTLTNRLGELLRELAAGAPSAAC